MFFRLIANILIQIILRIKDSLSKYSILQYVAICCHNVVVAIVNECRDIDGLRNITLRMVFMDDSYLKFNNLWIENI